MRLLDAVKMLVNIQGVSQKQIGKWLGISQQGAASILNSKDIKGDVACNILEFLGYEVIVREKRPGAKREDEILVEAGEVVDVAKMLMLRDEEIARETRKRRYEEIEAELRERYPRGMRRFEMSEYFEKSITWVRKYFDDYFYNFRCPIDVIIRIMKEKNL